MFYGSIPAIITPFSDGEVDYKTLEQFIEWQIDQGSHGIVACGTTGESPTLSNDEHMRIVKLCVDVVKGRIPVIAGSGSNCTYKTVEMTKKVKEIGADAALIVAPYYNKPTQQGLYEHYKKINDSVSIPLIIYNIPGRSVVDISNSTLIELAKLENITAVKDATGDLSRPTLLKNSTKETFIQLSGEDSTTASYLAQGGHGCISVTANILPNACAQMYEAWKSQDLSTFKELRDLLAPIHQALFIESSPAPVKYVASQLGICNSDVRLPLLKASKECRDVLDQLIKDSKLFSKLDHPSAQAYG
jgi:4-hydroxy-tetrahydrodipicolinate synthase